MVAQLEVEVEFYEKEIAEFQQEQEKLFAHMHKLRTELATDKTQFQLAGRTCTRAEVEEKLARHLDRCEQGETILKAKQDLVEKKRRDLQNTRFQVASYRDNFNQLVARSEALKAQTLVVEAAAAVGSVAVGTSTLGEAQRLAQQIEMRLRKAQRLLDAERVPLGGVPID